MRILFLFFLLVLVVGCQDIKEVPKPKNLIEEEKMVDVLVDISLLQGARTYNRRLLQEKGIEPYEYLWEKHQVDSVQFQKSNEYYAANYKRYQSIYDKVKARLEGLQMKYDSIREVEERKRDSINALEEKDTLEEDTLVRDLELDTSRARGEFTLPVPVSRGDSVQ